MKISFSSLRQLVKLRRLFRLAVRTSPLHGEDTGSSPVKDRKNSFRFFSVFFSNSVFANKELRTQFFSLSRYICLFFVPYNHSKISVLGHYTEGLQFIYKYELQLIWKLFREFYQKHLLWFKGLEEIQTLRLVVLIKFGFYLGLRLFNFIHRKVLRVYRDLLKYVPGTRFYASSQLSFKWSKKFLKLRLYHVGLAVALFLKGMYLVFLALPKTLPKKVSSGFHRFKEFCFVTYYYYRYYFPLHFEATYLLMSQMRKLRVLRRQLSSSWLAYIYSWSEIRFFGRSLSAFIYGTSLVRYQDMKISEFWEIGYPVLGYRPSILVNSMYQNNGYFFWSAEKIFELNYYNVLEEYFFVPQYLRSPECIASTKPSAQLEAILHWLAEKKANNQSTVVEHVLNELYTIFDEHFQLVIFEEALRDPLYLMRLHNFVPSSPYLQQVYEAGRLMHHDSATSLLFDPALIEKVCAHWEVTVHQSNYELIAWSTSAEYNYVFSNTPFRDAVKITKDSTVASYHATWLPEELVMRCQVLAEMFVFLYYQYFPVVRFHAYYDDSVFTGKEMYGALHPYFSLAGVNLQETLALPTTIVFFIMSYCFVRSAIIPVYKEVGIQAEWYLKFRTQCMIYYKIDPDEEFANDFLHLFIFACVIPVYYDWMRLPWAQRHLTWRYDMHNYVKFVHRLRRRRHSYNPAQLGDWDGLHLSKEPSLLVPLMDLADTRGRVRRKRRWQITNRIGFYPSHSVTFWNTSMRSRFRTYRNRFRHPWGPSISHFEQNWIQGLYRTLKRDKQQRVKKTEDTFFGSRHMLGYALFGRNPDWLQYKEWLGILKKTNQKNRALLRQTRQRNAFHIMDVSFINLRLGLLTKWERNVLAASHRFVKTDRMTADERYMFLLDKEAYYQYKSWTNQFWTKLEASVQATKPLTSRRFRLKKKKRLNLKLKQEAKSLVVDAKTNAIVSPKIKRNFKHKVKGSEPEPLLQKKVVGSTQLKNNPLVANKFKSSRKGNSSPLEREFRDGRWITKPRPSNYSLWRGFPSWNKAMRAKRYLEQREAWRQYFIKQASTFYHNVGSWLLSIRKSLPTFKHPAPHVYKSRFTMTDADRLRQKYEAWYGTPSNKAKQSHVPSGLRNRVFTNWVSRPQGQSIIDTTKKAPEVKLDLTLPSSTSWIIGPWRWTLPYETTLTRVMREHATLEEWLPERAYNFHLSYQEKELDDFYRWAHLHWQMMACLGSKSMLDDSYRLYVHRPAHEMPCGFEDYNAKDKNYGDEVPREDSIFLSDSEPCLTPRSDGTLDSQVSLPESEKVTKIFSEETRHPFITGAWPNYSGTGSAYKHSKHLHYQFMLDSESEDYERWHIVMLTRFQSQWRNRTHEPIDRLPYLLNQSHKYYATLFDRRIGYNWMAYLLNWDYMTYRPFNFGFEVYPCSEYDNAATENNMPFEFEGEFGRIIDDYEDATYEVKRAEAQRRKRQANVVEAELPNVVEAELPNVVEAELPIESEVGSMISSDGFSVLDNEIVDLENFLMSDVESEINYWSDTPSQDSFGTYKSSSSAKSQNNSIDLEAVEEKLRTMEALSPVVAAQKQGSVTLAEEPTRPWTVDDFDWDDDQKSTGSREDAEYKEPTRSWTVDDFDWDDDQKSTGSREDAEYKEQYYSSLALQPYHLPPEGPVEDLSPSVVPFDPEEYPIQRSRFQNMDPTLYDNLFMRDQETSDSLADNLVELVRMQPQTQSNTVQLQPRPRPLPGRRQRRPLELLETPANKPTAFENYTQAFDHARYLMNLERFMATQPHAKTVADVDIDALLPHSDATTFEVESPDWNQPSIWLNPETEVGVPVTPSQILPSLADYRFDDEESYSLPNSPLVYPHNPLDDDWWPDIVLPGEKPKPKQTFKMRPETLARAKAKHQFAMRPETPETPESPLFAAPAPAPDLGFPATKPPYAGPFIDEDDNFVQAIREIYRQNEEELDLIKRRRDCGETSEEFVERQFYKYYDPSVWPMTDSGKDTVLGYGNRELAAHARELQEMAMVPAEELIPRLVAQREKEDEMLETLDKLAQQSDAASVSSSMFDSASSTLSERLNGFHWYRSDSDSDISFTESDLETTTTDSDERLLRETLYSASVSVASPISSIKSRDPYEKEFEDFEYRDAVNELAESAQIDRIRFFDILRQFQPYGRIVKVNAARNNLEKQNASYHENARLRKLEKRALNMYYHSYHKLWLFATGKKKLPTRDLTYQRLQLEFHAFYPLNAGLNLRYCREPLLQASRSSHLDQFLLTQMLFDHTPETLFVDQYERITQLILPKGSNWQHKLSTVGLQYLTTELQNLEFELRFAWLTRLKQKYFLKELRWWETSWKKNIFYLPNLQGMYADVERFCGFQSHFDWTKVVIPVELQWQDYLKNPSLFVPQIHQWKHQFLAKTELLRPYVRTYLDFDVVDCFYHRKPSGEPYGTLANVHDNSIINKRLAKIVDRMVDGLHVQNAEEDYQNKMHRLDEEQPVFSPGWDRFRVPYKTRRFLGYKLTKKNKKVKRLRMFKENYEQYERMTFFQQNLHEWTHLRYRPYMLRTSFTRREKVAQNLRRIIRHPRWYGRLYAKMLAWIERKMYPYRPKIKYYKRKSFLVLKSMFEFFNVRLAPKAPHIRLKSFRHWRVFGLRLFSSENVKKASLRTILRPIQRDLWFSEQNPVGDTFKKERVKRTWARIPRHQHANMYDALQLLLYGRNAFFAYRMPYHFWKGKGQKLTREARDDGMNFSTMMKSVRKARLGRRRVHDFLRRPDIDAMVRKHNMYFSYRALRRKTLETALPEYATLQTRAELKSSYELNMSMVPRNLSGYDSCLQEYKHGQHGNRGWKPPQLPFEVRYKSIFGHNYSHENNNVNLNTWLRRERLNLNSFWQDLDMEFFRGMFAPLSFYKLANMPITTRHGEFRNLRTQFYLYTRPRWTEVNSLSQGQSLRSSSPLALLQGFNGTPIDYSLPVHQRHMRRSRDVAVAMAYGIAFADNMYIRYRTYSPRLWLQVEPSKKNSVMPEVKDFIFGHQYRAGLVNDLNGGYTGKLFLDNVLIERLQRRNFLRKWTYYNRMRGQRRRDSQNLLKFLGQRQKDSSYKFLHPKFWKKYYSPGLGYRFPGYLGYGIPGFPGARVIEPQAKYINIYDLLQKVPEPHLQAAVVASAFGYQAFPTDSFVRDLAYSLKYTRMLPVPGRMLEADGGFGGLAGDIASPIELIFKIRETCAENQAKYKLLGILNNIAYLDQPTPDYIYNRFAFPTFISASPRSIKLQKLRNKDERALYDRSEALINLNRWMLYSRVLLPTEHEVANLVKLFNDDYVPLIREEPKITKLQRILPAVDVSANKINVVDMDGYKTLLRRVAKYVPVLTMEDLRAFYNTYLDGPMDMSLLQSLLLSRSHGVVLPYRHWPIGIIRDNRTGTDLDHSWRGEFPRKKPIRALYRPMRGHTEFPAGVRLRHLAKGKKFLHRYLKEIRQYWKYWWRRIEEPKMLADTPEAFVDFFGYQHYFKRERDRVYRRVQRRMYKNPRFYPEFFFREKNTRILQDDKLTLRLYRNLSRHVRYATNQPHAQALIVRDHVMPALDMLTPYTQNLPTFVTGAYLLKYPELLTGQLGEHLKTPELRWRKEEDLARKEIVRIRKRFMGKCTVEELNEKLEPYWDLIDDISAARKAQTVPFLSPVDRPVATQNVPLRHMLRLEHTWPAEVMRDWVYFTDAQAQANSLELYQDFEAEIAPEPVGLFDVDLVKDYYKLVSILHGFPYQGPTHLGITSQLPNFNLRKSRYQNQNWWMRMRHVACPYPDMEKEWEEYTLNRPISGQNVPKYFERQRLVGGLRAGNLRDRNSVSGLAEMEVTYPQRWGWVAFGESHLCWINPLNDVASGVTTRVRYMSDVDIWQSWRKTPMRTLNLRDQLVLSGLYNVLQPAPNPLQYLVQATSPTTPVDVYGAYCDDSLGKVPYQWFDIYDPTTGEIVSVNKTRYLAFSQSQYLRRYAGFLKGHGPLGITNNITNSYQHHESLLTGFLTGEHIGTMEYMGADIVNKTYDHLVSKFEQTEKLFGMEFAVTSMLKTYYGVIPKQVIDFIVYGTYWGMTWLNAIYQASFLELPLKQLDLATPRDGMFDFSNEARELEQRLRNTQRKYLYTSGVDYSDVVDNVLHKWERDLTLTTFFAPFKDEDFWLLQHATTSGASGPTPWQEVRTFMNKSGHEVPSRLNMAIFYGYRDESLGTLTADYSHAKASVALTREQLRTIEPKYLTTTVMPRLNNPNYIQWLTSHQMVYRTAIELEGFDRWFKMQPHFETYRQYLEDQRRYHPDWAVAKNRAWYPMPYMKTFSKAEVLYLPVDKYKTGFYTIFK